MRLFVWLVRAFIFFTLFAFALNNQQSAVVHWFFGVQWNAPMVIIVLAAFAAGSVIGVLAMMPGWWMHWRALRDKSSKPAAPTVPLSPSSPPAQPSGLDHPPRDAV